MNFGSLHKLFLLKQRSIPHTTNPVAAPRIHPESAKVAHKFLECYSPKGDSELIIVPLPFSDTSARMIVHFQSLELRSEIHERTKG